MSSLTNNFVRLTLCFYKLNKVPVLSGIWRSAYNSIKNKKGSVHLKIHGYEVEQPPAFTYPFTSRLFKYYNNPLIESVYQTFKGKNRKINVVDAGAAIGDTVLLLKSNCPNMVKCYYCIEGDEEFFSYLQKNMKQFNDVVCIKSILSDEDELANELVRTHAGTASAQGENKVQAISMDHLAIEKGITKIDLIKIDVDGYDGKVLAGAVKILERDQPTVIFEWHPKLYEETENSYYTPFELLTSKNYERFIWFNKEGTFSHFSLGYDKSLIKLTAELCLGASFDDDLHYDIIALSSDSPLNIHDLANSDYSRNKKSPF